MTAQVSGVPNDLWHMRSDQFVDNTLGLNQTFDRQANFKLSEQVDDPYVKTCNE